MTTYPDESTPPTEPPEPPVEPPEPQVGAAVITTRTKDYLGRALRNIATAGIDYLGRSVVTGDLDYLGRPLVA